MLRALKEIAGGPVDWGVVGEELRQGKRSPSDTLAYIAREHAKHPPSIPPYLDQPFSGSRKSEVAQIIGDAVVRAPLAPVLWKRRTGPFEDYFDNSLDGPSRRAIHAEPASPWNIYFRNYSGDPPNSDVQSLKEVGEGLMSGGAMHKVGDGGTQLVGILKSVVNLGHLAPSVAESLRHIPFKNDQVGNVFESLATQALIFDGPSPDNKRALDYYRTVLTAMKDPNYKQGWLKGEFGPAPKLP